MNPDLALHEFHKTVSNETDEMRVYTVLASGEVVYQQVIYPHISCQVDLTLAFHESVRIEFTEAWATYYPDDRAVDRQAVARDKLIKAVLNVVGDGFDVPENDPGWQSEMHDEMLADAAKAYAAELRGFIHMPKFLDDDLVKLIVADFEREGMHADEAAVRRLWRIVRKSLKLDVDD